ncbi:MAG: hypothetical protein J3K34DRAFT_393614 [Monoraphidium minutum]|nr:MAG: hypothetical protein J3K34DRAFT_393614 [Monoraphidium minutum]
MKKKVNDEYDDDSSGSEPEEHNNAPAAARRSSGAAGAGGGGGNGASDSDAPSSSGSGSESGEEDSQDERALEEQLADIPLEVLAKLKQDGLGPTGDAARAAAAAAKQRTFKRETKNRPSEVTSKRPVSRHREVIQVPKHRGVDPRFDASIGGSSNPKEAERERKRYAFLYDEVLPRERAALKQRLKREGKRREIQAEITRVEQRLRDEKTRRKRDELEKGWKSEQKQAVEAGHKPFYLKKSEKRKRELVAKYEELKASGQLDKYMEKRRRKNASKLHPYLPDRRK